MNSTGLGGQASEGRVHYSHSMLASNASWQAANQKVSFLLHHTIIVMQTVPKQAEAALSSNTRRLNADCVSQVQQTLSDKHSTQH